MSSLVLGQFRRVTFVPYLTKSTTSCIRCLIKLSLLNPCICIILGDEKVVLTRRWIIQWAVWRLSPLIRMIACCLSLITIWHKILKLEILAIDINSLMFQILVESLCRCGSHNAFDLAYVTVPFLSVITANHVHHSHWAYAMLTTLSEVRPKCFDVIIDFVN